MPSFSSTLFVKIHIDHWIFLKLLECRTFELSDHIFFSYQPIGISIIRDNYQTMGCWSHTNWNFVTFCYQIFKELSVTQLLLFLARPYRTAAYVKFVQDPDSEDYALVIDHTGLVDDDQRLIISECKKNY